MYKIETKTETGSRTDYLQSWYDVLREGCIGGSLFMLAGVIGLLATPFLVIHAAYHQWKHGGVRTTEDDYHDHLGWNKKE